MLSVLKTDHSISFLLYLSNIDNNSLNCNLTALWFVFYVEIKNKHEHPVLLIKWIISLGNSLMDVPTIVLIIGVGQYKEENIPALPGAPSDAILFARALKNWCAEPVISIFLNSLATNTAIDSYFEHIEKITESFKFVFYFCGHGFRSQEPLPSSHLVLYDSKILEGKCHDALQLDSLVQKIHQIKACETYLFIDACYLRLNNIIHPSLNEELLGEEFKRSFFCLLSSGNQESFEDSQEDYGYFTQALLKSLSIHRSANLSPVVIVREICCALQEKRLPIPEMYNIDTQEMRFLPLTLPSTIQNGFINRPKLVAELQDILVQCQSKILVLTGEVGIGKTSFVQQLAADACHIFYLSLSPMESNLEALDRAIKEKFSSIIPDLQTKASLEECLASINHFFPAALLIVDHLAFEDQSSLIQFLSELSHLKTRFVLVLKGSLNHEGLVHEWQLPPFTLEETGLFITSTGRLDLMAHCELIHLMAKGNPQKIVESISLSLPSNLSTDEVNRMIIALYSVITFIDEDLFCRLFKLSPVTLVFFKDVGLIVWEEAAWRIHDFLAELARTNKMPVDRVAALRYFSQQYAQIEQDRATANMLISAILRLGYEPEVEPALQQAFFQLFQHGKKSLADLVKAAAIFADRGVITEAGLLLVDCLMDLGEFGAARKLLMLKALSIQTDIFVRLRQAHFFWRLGLFEKSIAAASQLLEDSHARSIHAAGYLHRGTAHFLSGNLSLAQEDFSQAVALTKEPNLLGWSKCMQGTIIGLLNNEISKAKKLLLSGIRSLVKCKDLRGAWLGWNNLGELSWKTHEYSMAQAYLEKAFEISNKLEILSMQLESLRNLFHLTLRTEGPFCVSMTHLFSQLMRFDLSDCEKDEKVQLFNTLATVHIFRGEIDKAILLLRLLIKLTARMYSQYHTYTLGNLALLFQYYEKGEKADIYLERAIALAKKHNHLLAIRQIKDDFTQFSKGQINALPLTFQSL